MGHTARNMLATAPTTHATTSPAAGAGRDAPDEHAMHIRCDDSPYLEPSASRSPDAPYALDTDQEGCSDEHNTSAEFDAHYSAKAASYDTFRAAAPGLPQILSCLQKTPAGLDILDLGCGTGAFFKHLYALKPASMVGIDVNEAMVAKAKAKASELSGSGTIEVLSGFSDILESERFDLIFCGQVIQNLTSDPAEAPAARGRFYAEMMRLLKPGGRVVLTTRAVPEGGRWSDLYWYADPAVVPQAVESMESVVPVDPKTELEQAGFAEVTHQAAAADDTMIRADAYLDPSHVSNSAFRSGDSFFQHVDNKGELGQLLENLDRLKADGSLAQYVEKRAARSRGQGQVATLEATRPSNIA